MPEFDVLVTQRKTNMLELAKRAWGKEWQKPDPAYEFTNRKFEQPADGGTLYNGESE